MARPVSHLETDLAAALEALRNTPARSDAEVLGRTPALGNLTLLKLACVAMIAWGLFAPVALESEHNPLTLNSVFVGVGLLFLVIAHALHSPYVRVLPASEQPVSPLLLDEFIQAARDYPEVADIVRAWLSSGHPLRRSQLRLVQDYVHLRRAVSGFDRLPAVSQPTP